QPGLEAPVRSFAVRPVRSFVEVSSADVGDVGIRKVAHELAQRVRLPLRVRVGEGEDLAACLAHRLVLRRHLAAAGQLQQADARRDAQKRTLAITEKIVERRRQPSPWKGKGETGRFPPCDRAEGEGVQSDLTDAASFSTESLASPNNITVLGFRKSGFSIPA